MNYFFVGNIDKSMKLVKGFFSVMFISVSMLCSNAYAAADDTDFINIFDENIEQKRDTADKKKLDQRRSALREALRNDQAQSLRQRSIDNNSKLINGLTENEIAERRDRNRQKLDSHEADLKNSKNDDASKLSTWINDNFRMQKKQEKNRKGNTDIFDVDNSTPSVSKEEEALIDLLSD